MFDLAHFHRIYLNSPVKRIQFFRSESQSYEERDKRKTLLYHKGMTIDPKALPGYTRKEEILNSSTHFAGALLSVGALIALIILEAINPSIVGKMWPFYIYLATMFVMFFNSGFYHSRKFGSKSRAISRVIDHCDIYLFVAGTYTPICIYGIANQTLSMWLLIGEWAAALIGVIINLVDMNNKAIKGISLALYLVAGWAIAAIYPFGVGLEFSVFLPVLLGGIAYSVGAILYGLGKKKRYFHSIFHFFVLIAAVLQFIGVMFLLPGLLG